MQQFEFFGKGFINDYIGIIFRIYQDNSKGNSIELDIYCKSFSFYFVNIFFLLSLLYYDQLSVAIIVESYSFNKLLFEIIILLIYSKEFLLISAIEIFGRLVRIMVVYKLEILIFLLIGLIVGFRRQNLAIYLSWLQRKQRFSLQYFSKIFFIIYRARLLRRGWSSGFFNLYLLGLRIICLILINVAGI